MDIRKMDETYIERTYGRFAPLLVSGAGSIAYDEDGTRYIDLGSGIAVNTFGFSDAQLIDAATAQLHTLQHVSNLYHTKPQVELAQLLCERTKMKKVFFSNSGTEANECAIKLARKWGIDRRGADCYHIISLESSFHGRSLGALAATGQPALQSAFGPMLPGFHYAPVGDMAAIEQLADENAVCSIMIELIQGEGGVNVLDVNYVRSLEAFCRERDMLLVIDEVQTGNGRTGALYAFEHYGITPDVVSTAKGLSGGLPMGATLIGERAEGTLCAGTHGSTFGGNPVCAAAALSVQRRIDDALLADVRAKGEYIAAQLQGAKGVKSVSGMGLLVGVELDGKAAIDVLKACEKRGVLLLSAKTKLRIAPALNIPMAELEEAIGILKEELARA